MMPREEFFRLYPQVHLRVYVDNQPERNMLRLCSTCGRRLVRILLWWQIMKIWKDQKCQKSTSKDSKNQEVFVTKGYEFTCANGTLRLLNRPRPSSTVEENLLQEDHVEIEEGHKKGKQNRRFVVHDKGNLFIDTMKN